jgi:hypothetical protein
LSAAELTQLEGLAAPENAGASLERRVRSFLDVNCAHCHGASPVRAAWDGAYSTPLAEQRMVWGPLISEYAGAGYYVIAPKDPAGSALLRRVASRDLSERMPPLGTSQPHGGFLALLREWIEGLPRREQEPPQILRARQRNETTIEVVFSEAVQPGAGIGGAERIDSYRLSNDGGVLAARLHDDARTVALTTTPLSSGTRYALTITRVADRAEGPNVLNQATVAVAPAER